jgi:flagellar biosynthesis/type III secretory pathway M-ring protein FliF/YscJ
MKKLLILFVILFSVGCSSLKKNKQQTKTETSVSSKTEQTTKEVVKKEESKSENSESKSETDATEFEVEIKPGDSLIVEKFDGNGKSIGATKYKGSGVVKNKKTKTIVTENKVAIEQNKIDSELNLTFDEESQESTKTDTKTKEVERSGIPFAIYFIFFLILILIIAYLIYKYRLQWIPFFKKN